MMKPTTFNTTVAIEVENAVMKVYGCERYDILQYPDTRFKKVVVFILYHHFKYDLHLVSRNYRMTYLYVPTVAEELAYWYQKDASVKEKIDLVLSEVEHYKIAV